jgi:hypothetical protein
VRPRGLHGLFDTAEGLRLKEIATGTPWRRWGPYLAERQWGTVREDYSANGEAWTFFPFKHAHSRAYRWGEDGLAGFCDEAMRWCLGLALWNGKDAILKERLFGLGGGEGNHGEDVKEVYSRIAWNTVGCRLKFPIPPAKQQAVSLGATPIGAGPFGCP